MKIIGSRLVLIDASALLYRSFYGLKPLTTSKGQRVQAVYGFFKSLKQLFDTYQPQMVAVVWDRGDSGRKEIFSDYKKNRQAPPSDLLEQRDVIQKICDAIKIPQIGVAGYEADDVIHSIIEQTKLDVDTVFVVSPDKDLRQLVSPRCVVVDPIHRRTYTEEEFFKKYEFEPSQLSSYFGLVGDSADDIPGVAGIGDTRATALIKQFKTIENLYENLDSVSSPALKKSLELGRESAFLGKKLFTLCDVVGFTCTQNLIAYDVKHWELAYPFFNELEFKSLVPASFELPKTISPVQLNWTVTVVDSLQALAAVEKKIRASDVLVVDTETTGLNTMQASLVGVSLALSAHEGFYISFVHDQWTVLQVAEIKKILGSVFLEHPCVVMHNAKFDLHVLETAGIQLPVNLQDTMLMAELLKSNEDQKVGLKALSQRVLGETMAEFKETIVGHKDFSTVPLADAAQYATHDVVQAYKLYKHFSVELVQNELLKKVYDLIELPLMKILFAMERAGILLDPEKLRTVRAEVAKEVALVDEKIRGFLYSISYEGALSFNPQSPKQVGEVLYDRLKLVSTQKTSGGQKSTSRDVLEQLAKFHPLPALILEYREHSKLINTYLDPLPALIHSETKRIHTSYSQVAVATGRLASSDPNLQNIPVSGAFGTLIRQAFIAPEGSVLVSADYSQIELRVLAHLTGDAVLTHAFLNNEDPHRQIAARLFSKPEDDVTYDERQIGKKINFSIIYGLTPYGLSQDLGISLKDARTYVEQYFAHYPSVKPWMERVEMQAREFGYVETLFGRRRYVSGLSESNKIVYEAARRAAINTVVQGTAADIIKMAMIHVDQKLREQNNGARMLLQIHDELLFECAENEAAHVSSAITQAMEHVLQLNVPLKVSVGVGKSWGDV